MRISQRVRATWEGKLFKKGTLCLAAIGILGGFFVAYAVTMANTIAVTAPASGAYWNDTKAITWATDKCAVGDNLAILVEDANNNDQVVYTMVASCSAGTKDLVTKNIDDGRYKIMVYRVVEGATDSGYSGVFTIDNQVPAITTETLITPDGGELWGGTEKTISWNAGAITDTNIGLTPISLYYSVDGAAPVLITSNEANDGSYDWTLPTGVNYTNVTVQIVATDLAGNKSSDASDTVFAIDTVKPSVARFTRIDSNNTKTQDIVVEYDDVLQSVAPTVVFKNGANGINIASTHSEWGVEVNTGHSVWHETFTMPDNLVVSGATIVISGALDPAGNTQNEFTSPAFAIDTQKPTATFVAPDFFGENTFTNRTLTGLVSDEGSGVASVKVIFAKVLGSGKQYWNGNGWQSWQVSNDATVNGGTWSFALPAADNLENGATYAVVPIAKDAAGNEDNAATGDTMEYDNLAPVLAITAPTATLTNIAAQAVAGTITEANPDMIKVNDVVLSGGEVTSTGFSKNVTLAEGSNSYTVIATDKAGNSDSKTVAITLDTQASIVTVSSLTTDNNIPKISGTISDASATLTVSAGSVGFTVQKTGTAWTATAISALADGKYNVLATATDEATNVGSDTTIDELVVDTTAPTIDDFSLPVADAVFTTTSATANVPLAFVASDATTAITCSFQIDGAGTAEAISCTSPVSVPVPDGRHTVTVTVKDGVDKTASATSASFVVNADNILTVGKSGAEYTSIAAAIAAAKDLDTIKVVDSATYTEPLVVDKDLSFVALTSSVSPVATHPVIASGMKIAADGVSIDGFTISNLNDITGIYSTGARSNVSITNNTFTNIGTAADHGAAVYFEGRVTNITVNGNTISNVGKTLAGTYSSKGIYFGDSDGTETSDDIEIKHNHVSGIFAPSNKGAYGITINYGANTATGQVTGVEISENEVSSLNGGWTTAIGLETKTPGAKVTKNTIGALGNAPVGVNVEANTALNTIVIKQNKFDASITGVFNQIANSTVLAPENWWGTNVKSQIKAGGKYTTALVDFAPWYLSGGTDANGVLNGKLSSAKTLTVGDDAPADFTTISAALDAATDGTTIYVAAGTYQENLTINKKVSIIGAGNETSGTIVRKLTNIPVVELAASGNSATDPILLKDLRIEPVGVYGINVGNGTVSFVKLENVSVVGNPASNTENEVGLKVAQTASLTDIVVSNSSFSYCDHGWYFAKKFDGDDLSVVRNVTVSNTSFLNNDFKGAYIEKLSEASFAGITVSGNGTAPNWNMVWNGGFDINLKNGVYQNITISNATVTGNGLGYKEGAGLMIKARSDGGTYGARPATLSGVTINGGAFTGNERGIRFGEPDKGNAGPSNVVVHGANISGNVKTYAGTDGSAYGDLVNQAVTEVNAENNWWGTAVKSQIKTYGLVDFTPWYLEPTMINLSSSDSTKPTVVLSHVVNPESVVRTSVKNADTVVITATFTETNGIEEASTLAPRISIGNLVANAPMTKVNNLVWTYTWDVPAGNSEANAVSVLAYDTVGNANDTATGSTNFVIDNTAPVFHVTDTIPANGVSATPTKADFISVTTVDNSVLVGAHYGFSDNETCDSSDTIDNDGTVNGKTFTFTVGGNHTNYLCVKADDQAGNSSIQVVGDGTTAIHMNVDNTAPILTVPANIAAEATSASGAAVTFAATTDADATVACTPASGSVFPLGTNTVSCTATDLATNSVTGSFTVTVQDKTAPVISGTPANITNVQATSAAGAVATFTAPTATDIVDGSVTVSCVQPSGSTFALGTSTVKCSATDQHNNKAETSFTVTVVDTTGPVITPLSPEGPVSFSNPQIAASYADVVSGIDVTQTKLWLDGVLLSYAEATAIGVSAQSPVVAEGSHALKVSAADSKGNSSVKEWNFWVLKTSKSVYAYASDTSIPANGTSTTVIHANVTEDNNPVAGATVKFFTTGGTLSIPAVTDIDGNTSATLTSPTTAGSAQVRVSYGTGSELVKYDVAVEFTDVFVDPTAPVTSASINLHAGWNLISLPLIPTSSAIDTILDGIEEKVNIVQSYENGGWTSYSPNASGDKGALTTMQEGKGYWIDMDEAVTLTINGREKPVAPYSPFTFKLKAGEWNLIGFQSPDAMKAKFYIVGMDDNDELRDGSNIQVLKDQNMTPGYGYWFYAYDGTPSSITAH